MEQRLSKKEAHILQKLRTIFLSEKKPVQPYWETKEDLLVYDKVFGQRIRWKWQSVLKELSLLGWIPPQCPLVDWGCGTGVAARSFCHWAVANNYPVLSCFFWDHSPLAIQYAQTAFSEEFPNIPTNQLKSTQLPEAFILLLSHVMGELSEQSMEEVLAIAKKAIAILWVEPAKKQYSKTLIQLRELFREKFLVIAPCLHQERCPMLNEQKDWCHFFASVPRQIFQSSFWSDTQNLLGIDLGSLAYSYLVLDSRKIQKDEQPHFFRMIGTIRHYKGYSHLLCCYATAELRGQNFLHRYNPWLAKKMKKGTEFSTLAKITGQDTLQCQPFEKQA
ncbi:small ribosomal subunit Rsm22 family protein [Methylacidiphilum caldifontis]|uniref:Methyltransferase n=1 Tax=Methylacidiphilum caldifontis TaxID=2795386 RepID=A0A4Y8PCG2_9BACT|nr:small ribosomal subunit Rsm22 family protein [Methylacidiphilum caldifontis]TFE68927.1 methyltransferase [Methylacidiphilum caldifontis]